MAGPIEVNYEDTRMFSVWSPNMATAVMAINKTKTAHLLLWIAPDQPEGYWLVFKDDSWVKKQWKDHFPNAVTLA